MNLPLTTVGYPELVHAVSQLTCIHAKQFSRPGGTISNGLSGNSPRGDALLIAFATMLLLVSRCRVLEDR
jgi:hypothetical protein